MIDWRTRKWDKSQSTIKRSECSRWQINCFVVGESHCALPSLTRYFCCYSLSHHQICGYLLCGHYSPAILPPFSKLLLASWPSHMPFSPLGMLPACSWWGWLLYPWDISSKVIPPSGHRWITHWSSRFPGPLAPSLCFMALSRTCNHIFVLCPPSPILGIKILECKNHLCFLSR